MSLYEVGLIVLILLVGSNIGSVVATYLTVLCTVAMALKLGAQRKAMKACALGF